MRKVIYDCDNTMGIKNRDIDDGLALIYLLEEKSIDLLGVTCTYGNDNVDIVFNQTKELAKDIGEKNLKIFKGNKSNTINSKYEVDISDKKNGCNSEYEVDESDKKNGCNSEYEVDAFDKKKETIYEGESKLLPLEYKSDASSFIVDMVNKYPNEVSIIATGSMRNIYDAYNLDNELFSKVDEIILMGGTTSPLLFGEKEMKELNFTVFPQGIRTILENNEKTAILTGNNCMEVEFTRKHLNEIEKLIVDTSYEKYKFVLDKIESWMNDFKEEYNYDAIILWDLLAAVYFVERELFIEEKLSINIDYEKLQKGRLTSTDEENNYEKLQKGRLTSTDEENNYEKLQKGRLTSTDEENNYEKLQKGRLTPIDEKKSSKSIILPKPKKDFYEHLLNKIN